MTIPLTHPIQRSSLGGALLVAIVIEALLLTGVAGYLQRSPAPLPASVQPIALELVAPPTPEPPTPEPPKPPEATPEPPKPEPPKPEPPKPEPPKPHPVVHPAAKPIAPPTPVPAGPISDAPSDFATPPASAAPPPPPPPSASATAATATDLFQAQLRAAVQAAVRYPSVARIMKLVGQTKVGFDYRDGHIANPRIVRSSGRDILDQAALEALQNADFPPPPKELTGQLLKLEINVVFTLQP